MFFKRSVPLVKAWVLGLSLLLTSFCNLASSQSLSSSESLIESSSSRMNGEDTNPLSQSISEYETSEALLRLLLINSQLEEKVTQLSREVESLSVTPPQSNGISDDRFGYAAVLLTSVAVIVTALGVVIAILSLIGYAKIKSTTKKAAEDAAKAVVLEKINQTVSAELIEIFSEENLNIDQEGEEKSASPIRKVILEAVAKVIYRDIYFDKRNLVRKGSDNE